MTSSVKPFWMPFIPQPADQTIGPVDSNNTGAAMPPRRWSKNNQDDQDSASVTGANGVPSRTASLPYRGVDNQSHDGEGGSSFSSMEEIANEVQELKKTVKLLQELHGSPRDQFLINLKGQLAAGRGEGSNTETAPSSDQDRVQAAFMRSTEDGEGGWRLKIKRWKRVKNRYGSAELYDDTKKIEDIAKKEHDIRSGGFVISVYDDYDVDLNKQYTLLEIHSTPLLELLRSVIKFYPGDDFDILRGKDSTDGTTVTFASPYTMFFSYRRQLEDCLEEGHYSMEAKQHLKLLLDFMRKEHPVINAKLTEIQEGRCEKIAFDKIWLLYPPNTEAYSIQGAGKRQVVVYSHHTQNWTNKGPTGYTDKMTKIVCWEVLFEHGVFKRDFTDWIIEPYVGEKSVRALELVPAQYMDDEPQLRNRLTERGRRYFELNKRPSLQDYYGERFPRVFKDEPVRVVVDEGTYWQKQPARVQKGIDPSQDYGFPKGEENLVDHEGLPLDTTFLRCFPEVGVFSLRNKEWGLVKVDDLKPVEFRKKAFKRLVIRDDHKKIIKAMVQASNLDKPGFQDLVSGKGRGLTILLHGPPGTGKTLTAECVAEKNECPLFTISCGDLGTKPQELEVRLKEVFQYAVTWKAILLLDEADIFLQERDVHDVKRNALVSIFLRELDYFEGILFLSTNRPGEIDEAFVSRVHITLGLNTLTTDEQHRIWAIFVKDLELSDAEKRKLMGHIKENYQHDALNGRQIRNTVRTALALAQLRKEGVMAEHLDSVMTTVREYTSYLKRLNGMNPEESAFAMGRRVPGNQKGANDEEGRSD